jgi:hypothetical protein
MVEPQITMVETICFIHVVPSAPSSVHVQQRLPEHENNGFAQLFGHVLALW